MIESSLRIRFLCGEEAAGTFEKIVEYLKTSENVRFTENVRFKRRDKQKVALFDDLIGNSLFVEQNEDHPYKYSKSVVTLTSKCERFTRPDGEKRLESVLGFVKELHEEVGFSYVFGMHTSRIENIDSPYEPSIPSPVDDDELGRNRIVHPTWLMLFSPEMVEEYGREWLLDLPADRAQELEDGAILIVATEDIVDCETDVEIIELINDAMKPIEAAFDNRESS